MKSMKNAKVLMVCGSLLAACSGPLDADEAQEGAAAAGPDETAEVAAAALQERCASGGQLDFRVLGAGLSRHEGRRVVAAAFENQLTAGATRHERVVLRTGTIRGGAFTLSCARSLRENYAYPSYGVYIDVDGNGRCNRGDLGYQMALYGWNQDVRDAIPAASLQEVSQLSPPLGGTARSFCAGYFR